MEVEGKLMFHPSNNKLIVAREHLINGSIVKSSRTDSLEGYSYQIIRNSRKILIKCSCALIHIALLLE